MNARSDKATIPVNHWLAVVYSAGAAQRRGKQPAVPTVMFDLGRNPRESFRFGTSVQ